MSRENVEAVEVRAAVRITDSPAFGLDAVGAVAREIGTFGIAGQAIDGAALGIPGWVIARMIGDPSDSTVLRYNDGFDHTIFDVHWDDLREHLQSVFGADVQVSDEITADGHTFARDGLFALGTDSAVLVVPTGDHLYAPIAAGIKAPLRRLTIDGYDIVELAERPSDEELVGALMGVSGGLGRKRAALLWRRGPISGVGLLRKGRFTAGKVWEPAWLTIEPATVESHDLREWVSDIVDDLGFGEPDVGEFVSQFALDNEATVNLRALLRRPEPDFDVLVGILGLPAEIGQILSGDLAMNDCPGLELFESASPREVVLAEFSRVPEGSGFFDGIQRASIEGARWYVFANLVFVGVCVLMVWDAIHGGSPLWMGILAGLFGLLTAAEQVLRARVRGLRSRRRARQP